MDNEFVRVCIEDWRKNKVLHDPSRSIALDYLSLALSELDRLREENERLEKVADAFKDALDCKLLEGDEEADEVDRLRAEVARLRRREVAASSPCYTEYSGSLH